MAKYYKFDDMELDEDILRKAQEEINETEESRKKCLDILRKKLTAKKELDPCLKEEFLMAFVRVSKFDAKNAYQRIIKYYEEKWNLPEIFNNFCPSTVRIVENVRRVYACPYRAKDNSAVFILKRYSFDSGTVPYNLVLRMVFLISEMFAQQPINQLCGATILLDLSSSGSSWSEYTPSRLKLIAKMLQRFYPFRVRAIYILNAPAIYYILFSMIYPFLSTKMKNRVIVPKRFEELHSRIDPQNLPKEYGGYLEESELIDIHKRIYENEDFFREISTYGFISKNT